MFNRSDLPKVSALETRIGTDAVHHIIVTMMRAHDRAEKTQHSTYPVSHVSTYVEILEAVLETLP